MSNTGFGRSMGRDWGGRRKLNPDNAPRVTRNQVLDFAATHGLKVKRDGNSSWLHFRNGTWYSCGMTNYLALRRLERYVSDGE